MARRAAVFVARGLLRWSVVGQLDGVHRGISHRWLHRIGRLPIDPVTNLNGLRIDRWCLADGPIHPAAPGAVLVRTSCAARGGGPEPRPACVGSGARDLAVGRRPRILGAGRPAGVRRPSGRSAGRSTFRLSPIFILTIGWLSPAWKTAPRP